MNSQRTDGSKVVSDTKQVNFPNKPSTESQTMIVETTPVESATQPHTKPESLVGLSAPLEKSLVQIFKLLSDVTRVRILMFLAKEKELHVSALCDRLGQSQPAVSHHLALLRVAGLAEARREGKHNFYSVCRPHFQRVMTELFSEIADPVTEEFRFENFAVTHRS